MKRKVFIAALLIICLALLGFGTSAYFTADGTATNVITSGGIAISIDENAVNEEGETVTFKDVQGVMPGTRISKIVSVTNTGANSAWVRIAVDTRISLADGVEGTPDTSLIKPDFNTSDWTLGADGYYYYNTQLQPGESTVPLFTVVTFDSTMGNIYQRSTAYIDVYAAAVQTANNGASALDASGWPDAE